jgi:hypothetical protein
MRKILSLAVVVMMCATLALYSSGTAPADDHAKQEMEKIKADWGAWKDLRRELAASYVTNADRIRLAFCDGDEEQIQSRVEDAEKSAKGNVPKQGWTEC